MQWLTNTLTKLGLLREDLDYHLIRAAMVLIFFFFGYQKWFTYEAYRIVPYITHGPLIFWLRPVFGFRGEAWFLGVSEWLFGLLLFAGYWNKTCGVLGAIGGIGTFVSTTTVIPFIPNGWDASAGGFPAMTGMVPSLMKDVVLLAVSFYLLRQDLTRLNRDAHSSQSEPVAQTLPE